MPQTIPPSASAQDLIAQGFAALGREAYEEAAHFARAGLAAAPGDPGAMTLLGRLAMAASRPDVALEIFTNLAQPGAPAATWLDLARAQLDLRREEQALETAQYAVQLAPQSAQGWFLIGEIATMLNRMPEAAEALRRVLELAPNDTDAFPRLCRIVAVTDEEVATAERKLAKPGLAPAHAANLHYGLASVYKRRQEPKKYIAHLLGANAAQREAFTGVLPDLKAANERLVSIFSKAAFARAARANPMQPTPIFIVGMPRSGTTLVEQIVTSAEGVVSAGELKFFRDILPTEMEALTGQRFPEGFETLSAAQLDSLAAPLTKLLRDIGGEGARYVTDKTLDNFQRIGLLLHVFPESKIICLRRDPMDVCYSMLQQQFPPTIVQTFDMALMGQASRRFADIVAHWRTLFEGRFLEVQYEALVAAPEAQTRRITDFCGFKWRNAFLSFHERESAVRTFSDQQVRRPIYNASVGAWRAFADELAPLRRALDDAGVKYEA